MTVNKIQDVFGILVATTATGYEIYKAAATHMDQLEIKNGLTGTQKKAVVLDFLKGTIAEVANNWVYWFGLLSKFIDGVKTLYNVATAR